LAAFFVLLGSSSCSERRRTLLKPRCAVLDRRKQVNAKESHRKNVQRDVSAVPALRQRG